MNYTPGVVLASALSIACGLRFNSVGDLDTPIGDGSISRFEEGGFTPGLTPDAALRDAADAVDTSLADLADAGSTDVGLSDADLSPRVLFASREAGTFGAIRFGQLVGEPSSARFLDSPWDSVVPAGNVRTRLAGFSDLESIATPIASDGHPFSEFSLDYGTVQFPNGERGILPS